MNRQIKFRVWNGHSMEYRVLAGALGHFYVEGMSQKDSACLSDFNTIYHESAPLMQFTGLLDKNGAEIYEGDILISSCKLGQRRDVPPGTIFAVYWNSLLCNYALVLALNEIIDYPNNLLDLTRPKSKNLTIIGNIHVNPELLEGAS